MTFRSRRFEREVRRLVRGEVNASPELRAEYARRRPRWTEGEPWVLPILLCLEPLALFAKLRADAQAILALLTLQALVMAFRRADQLVHGLRAPWELMPYALFPISDADVFRHQWGATVRSSFWALYVFTACYVALGAHGGGRGAVVGAVALAGIQWALTLSLGVLFARLSRLGQATIVATILFLAFIFFFSVWHGPRPWLSRELGLILSVTPAGWVALAFEQGLLGGLSLALFAAAPALLLVLPAAWTFRAMRRSYSTAGVDFFGFAETAEAEVEDSIEQQIAQRTGLSLESVGDPELAAKLRDAAETALAASAEQGILEGRFLAPMNWRRGGTIEQVVGRGLGRRERIVAELLVGGAPNWTGRWQIAALLLAPAALVLAVWPGAPAEAIVLPAVLATLVAVPVLGGSWPALGRVPCGEHSMPLYALFPVTYLEMATVISMANALRCVAWLPVLAAYCAAFLARSGLTPLGGALLAAKAVAVAIAAQPLLVAWRVAYGGMGNQNLNLKKVGLLFLLVAGSAGFAWGASFFLTVGLSSAARVPMPAGSTWLALAGAGAMVALSLATCLFFGWLHNRGTLDLVHTSPE